MRCLLPTTFAVLLALLASGALAGQTPPVPVRATAALRVVTPKDPEVEAGGIPVAASAVPQDPTVTAGAATANQRVQKWKALQYDRRPSTILQAWARPELRPYDPAEEAAAKNGAPSPVVGSAPPSREEIERMLVEQFSASSPGAVEVPGGNAAAEQQLAEKRLQREFEMFQRDVTLGRWERVGEFLATMPAEERRACYEHLLRVLPHHPQRPEDQRVPPHLQEKNRFSFEDALAIAGLAPPPDGFDKKLVPLLAPLVQRALEHGSVPEELVRLLAVEVAKPASEQRLDRREAALLLSAIGLELELGPFLPAAAEAEQANDREGLNLLARHALALHQKEQRNVHLETAWTVTQMALAQGDIGEEEKKEALRRAVELAPKVRADLGPAWLAESFTKRPERGMEIIATIGAQVAKGFQERPGDTKFRAAGLQLQKTAVEALLQTAPQLAAAWRPTLGLLAAGWIVEASHSYAHSQSDSLGPVMERDEFGNLFWTTRRRGGGGQIAAVEPADLLAAQPGAAWAAQLDDALRPHFATVSAQLLLKVNEEERAFPFIEQLATTNPRKAKELADEFLRVWMRNNNPNSQRRTNPYMFMYGFDRRSDGIPLTRSKQDRNLAALGSWVERLRQLPIGGVDQKLLTEAFVAAHSSAEVYRLETIERVFGDVGALDPVLLGELLGKMRTNLATIWRLPAVQEREKTRRSLRETLEEVARGYETALQVAQQALRQRGQHWALLAVVASILHDQNNFSRELQRDSNFAEVRKNAFELFAAAAEHYAQVVDGLRLDEETIRPYDTWFYAALGASDLGAVDEETVLARSQLSRIRAAIDALPQPARDRHLGMFANALFTRMSAVKPQIKYRYLEAGFAIVGDHPQAAEAKKVWDYYQDLLAELRLEAVVEGPPAVGTAPFGLRVDIVHSPEIERESGGFQKYTTNQNNQPYAWNYGRPLENYRDKFQESVGAALQEHFEVLSVTFNSEAMASKPTGAAGWRRTPYAWLLLKARGPQVDRVPEIKLDLDFLDTSGFTILPIGSSPVVVDAASPAAVRPWSNLRVTQILDERRADEGKITLEIKATCHGLVPDLDAFLRLDLPGFQVVRRDDQGAAVTRFREDQEGIESERVWLLSLQPEDGKARPMQFVFGRPAVDGIEAVYQRYDDADLATVTPEVALGYRHAGGDPAWAWVLLGLAFVGYFAWFLTRRDAVTSSAAKDALRLPQQITPFTVLALLEQVRRRVRLDASAEQALVADMARIEATHFQRGGDPSPDLAAVARAWLARIGNFDLP